MSLFIRNEKEEDFKEVENITREAFWNLYVPGCDEHLLVHNIRKHKDYIKELDFVALIDDKIVGNIMFTHSYVECEDGSKFPTITFGPLSVLPEFQNQGIGSSLMEYALHKALDEGYNVVVIYGYPDYYSRFGFKNAKEFNITNPEGKYPAAHLILELVDGALDNINGKFIESSVFQPDKDELEDFDKQFPIKTKEVTDSQKRFEEMVCKYL